MSTVANEQGSFTTPSFVSFTDEERLIGESAKNQAAMNPANTIFDIKYVRTGTTMLPRNAKFDPGVSSGEDTTTLRSRKILNHGPSRLSIRGETQWCKLNI